MPLTDQVQFPCDQLPEADRQARLLGIYPQRQDGLFMQRVRVPGGRITCKQWQGLAGLARGYTPDYPLHLTTRQDVELHGIAPADIPAVQQGISTLGLSGAGACGDTVRNITCCPANGLHRGTWDVSEFIESIQARIESIPWITALPRKFKISVCGCGESCTRPWINDLGLVANNDGTFRANIAGSLGARPAAGILFHQALPVEHLLPLVVALLRLFRAEGDRRHRHCARLRHVRERLGDGTFMARVEEFFRDERSRRCSGDFRVWQVGGDTPLQSHLRLPLGDVMPEEALEVGWAVETAGARLRIGLAHDLLLYGHGSVTLSQRLRTLSARAQVVACPGSTWCNKGIVDARHAADRIGRRLQQQTPVPIAVSGCPNNCPQAALASIGLVGRVRKVGGRRVSGFRILVGGGQGANSVLAREVCPFVSADRVDEAVEWIVNGHRRAVDHGSVADLDEFCSTEFEHLADMLERRFGSSAIRNRVDVN